MIHFGNISADELAKRYGTPLYIYEGDKIRTNFRRLVKAFRSSGIENIKIHYAAKANSNPWILKLLRQEGASVDVVSPGEIFLAEHAGFNSKDMLFTQNSVSDEEMKFALEKGIMINVESLSQLVRLGKIAPGSEISIRFNIYVGAGHHSHVITGGPESKFGIDWEKTDEVKETASRGNLKIKGVHCHIGSGILQAEMFVKAVKNLFKTAMKFKNLDFVDLGGGIGVPYRPGERAIDIEELAARLSGEYKEFCKAYGDSPDLALEPGRFLVAESGSLLCRVTSIKKARKYTFIGTNTGFNHLIRPAFYGSYHHIEPVEERKGKSIKAVITGNLCESGDVFTRTEEGIEPREFSPIEEGDLLAIRNAGAYGFTMASHYNSFLLPPEILIDGDSVKLIRKREKLEDLLLNVTEM